MHIQVKTFLPGTKTCNVGLKAERRFGPTFFWVLAGIPAPMSTLPFEYFVIPCEDMATNVARYHQNWLGIPGKNARAHRDDKVRAVAVAPGAASYFWHVESYRNQWPLLERVPDD